MKLYIKMEYINWCEQSRLLREFRIPLKIMDVLMSVSI
jgi:hypothetical protein